MKYINPFSLTIGGTKIENHNLGNYKSYINSQDLYSNGKNGSVTKNQNLLDDLIFTNLKKDILKYSKQYLTQINHNFQDIQISASWANVLNQNEKIFLHNHSNSYISGVIYLNYGANIKFIDPIDNLWTFTHHPNPVSYEISPEPGLILLFPSFVNHQVETSQENNRVSIAFNIIPKGPFGWNTANLNL